MATHTFTSPGRIGRRVLYCLNDADVREIQWQRQLAGKGSRNGNDPKEGQVYPGVIVADFYSPLASDEKRTVEDRQTRLEQSSVNLQVFLDGNDSYWATSRSQWIPGKEINPLGHWIFAE